MPAPLQARLATIGERTLLRLTEQFVVEGIRRPEPCRLAR